MTSPVCRYCGYTQAEHENINLVPKIKHYVKKEGFERSIAFCMCAQGQGFTPQTSQEQEAV